MLVSKSDGFQSRPPLDPLKKMAYGMLKVRWRNGTRHLAEEGCRGLLGIPTLTPMTRLSLPTSFKDHRDVPITLTVRCPRSDGRRR